MDGCFWPGLRAVGSPYLDPRHAWTGLLTTRTRRLSTPPRSLGAPFLHPLHPPLLTLPCMQATLELVRTTAHGQRHECSKCGGVLSIVYDSQPDCIWPVAGAIDDESYPSASTAELSASLCRVVHICCSDLQSWIELPDDGLPRLKFAG